MKIEEINPDWSNYDCRAVWGVVTSRELSEILGVSLQTINNWKMRRVVLPLPVTHKKLKGNYNYYRISQVRAILEGTTEEEVCWSWARRWMPHHIEDIDSLGKVEYLVNAVPNFFGVKKSPIPLELI